MRYIYAGLALTVLSIVLVLTVDPVSYEYPGGIGAWTGGMGAVLTLLGIAGEDRL